MKIEIVHGGLSIEKMTFEGDHSGGGAGDLKLDIKYLSEIPLVLEVVYDRCFSWNNGGVTEQLARARYYIKSKPDPEELYYLILQLCDDCYKKLRKAAAKRADVKFLPPKPEIQKENILEWFRAEDQR